ncbi:universal stress protein [Nocardia sp. NBC_01730]|uniref:universal stress protein n=1 Tax=Nocardia sp. NBC_01730 TaxID=2975998 RepID=UPI002E0D7701|nr:universal stress protein [Nocardia sp. NBC_01730]
MTSRFSEEDTVAERIASPSEPFSPPIVVAVDGSATACHAVAWAAVDAGLHCCRLHIVTSVSIPTGYGPGVALTDADTEWLCKDGERVLTEANGVARVAAYGEALDITTELVFDPIIPYLITRSRQARMVVVGSRGLGAIRRGLLGSVSTAVTRHAHCPVTVVHSTSATDALSSVKPVLVGVDGTENSVPAVEVAFEEASRRKVSIMALHAWSDQTSGLDVGISGWDVIHDTEDAVLAESLAGYTERYPDVSVTRVLLRDRPVRCLLDESERAQLVVVGSHGRGGFAGILLGSTSNALLQSVECPIIVVRQR